MKKPRRIIDQIGDSHIDRFFEKVVGGKGIHCWEWGSGRNSYGYGAFAINGQNYAAHRVSYVIYYGIDPGEMLVCHACDNPPCVNPQHLWLGDNQSNQRDASSKGSASRGRWGHRTKNLFPTWIKRIDAVGGRERQHGDDHGSSKLMSWQVEEMRKLYEGGNTTYKTIAQKYGVHLNTAYFAIQGRNWAHI